MPHTIRRGGAESTEGPSDDLFMQAPMTQLDFLLSEVAWLTRELETLPDSAILTKASTRARLAEVERQLALERERKDTPRFVSGSCLGEVCGICLKHLGVRVTATCKVGEEIAFDDPSQHRHNLTAYLCSRHFDEVFAPPTGVASVAQQGIERLQVTLAQTERELETARLRIHEATQKLAAEFGAEGSASLEEVVEKAVTAIRTPLLIGGGYGYET